MNGRQIEFFTHEAARDFASWAASPMGLHMTNVTTQRTEGGFSARLSWGLKLETACQYIVFSCRNLRKPLNNNITPVLDEVKRQQLQSPGLAWCDPESNLTWDVAGLLQSQGDGAHPQDCSDLLNAFTYAGHSDWRMPTVAELKTLGKERFVNIGLLTRERLVDYRVWLAMGDARRPWDFGWLDVWSCEENPLYKNEPYIGVNLHSLASFTQDYSETHERYRHTAHTIMVRG